MDKNYLKATECTFDDPMEGDLRPKIVETKADESLKASVVSPLRKQPEQLAEKSIEKVTEQEEANFLIEFF